MNNLLETLKNITQEKKESFVLYREPISAENKHQTLNLYQGKNGNTIGESGFIFHPFDHQHPVIFFDAKDCKKKQYNVYIEENQKPTKEIDLSFLPQIPKESSSFAQYAERFSVAKMLLEQKQIEKIVLSHQEKIEKPIHLFNVFFQLLKNFPFSFVYCLYTPNTGIWLGASPELLLEQLNECFSTIALAGTQRKETFTAWLDKEKNEQALVEKFIIDT